jgi:RHS repeat-associated protein
VVANPFQYTGRELDGTGLYFYRARYYSPAFQRFISEDPSCFGGGDINLYSYVRNSPPNFTDSCGMIGSLFPFPIPLPIPLRNPLPGRKNPPQNPPAPPKLSPGPPGIPPDPLACSPYLDGTGAGQILFRICMHTPDSPWNNCVRDMLLQQYVPNGNPLDLSIYLFWDHPRDFVTCTIQ